MFRSKNNNGSSSKSPLTKEDILNVMDNFQPKQERAAEETSDGDGGSDTSPPTESNESSEDISPTSTSIINSYCTEWERLFLKPDYMKALRMCGLEGKLRSSRFRSIVWRLNLEVLPESMSEWVQHTTESRRKFEEAKDRVLVNPRHKENDDLHLNNPLSQHNESPWNQFFQDNELKVTIKQDVIRTYPKIEFFHQDKVRSMMVDILFVYAKLKPVIAYRQGMHELLAPLIFVLHCDHQAFLHASETESVEGVIKELLNPDYIEHDAYTMFCQVMDTVELWYVSKEFYPRNPKPVNSIAHVQPFARPDHLNPSNAIVTKLTRIQDYILKKYDIELYMHLERLDIAPQIYGIRWVRLLFGRELPMQDLLAVWDAIFADTISFDLVDYLFVSMLMYIRDVLLSSDYPTCLHILMRYPPVGDVNNIIQRALHLREPNLFPKPPMYTFQQKLPEWGIVGMKQPEVENKPLKAVERYKPNPVMSGLATLGRKMNVSRSANNTLAKSNKKLPKSTSEPMNLVTDTSPDEPPTSRKGSTASEPGYDMPSVKPAAFKPTLSANSIARMDTSRDKMKILENLYNNGDFKYATLPHSHKTRNRKNAKELRAVQNESATLQGKLNEMSNMHQFCATKLDVHIGKLQSDLMRQDMENEDEILLALAGLKQVRDILKGTLKFSQALIDGDEIVINEDHYKQVVTNEPRSHDQSLANQKRMFYTSSTEPSEGSPMSEPLSDGEKLPSADDFELEKVATLTNLRQSGLDSVTSSQQGAESDPLSDNS